MNLHKLIFTNNACYRAGRRITPKASWYTPPAPTTPGSSVMWGRMTAFWGRTNTTTTGTSLWIGRSAFMVSLVSWQMGR